MPLRKVIVPFHQGLFRPIRHRESYAPMCALCRKEVDSEELVERNDRWVKVLVKCHGAEELASFELGCDWTEHELGRAMQKKHWFWPAELGI